jgi:NAD(P)-dependent dehydrogenase (short-subunit alcohol dehydrogenase family)
MMTSPTGGGKQRRRALVTGGAVRVGRAIALALAGAGMDVAITYHGSGPAAARTVRALRRRGVEALALRADLADARQPARVVARAAAELGGLDVLVNNAAVFFRTPPGRTTVAAWDRLLDLNLRGSFLCAQAAARLMRRRGGHIVNVGDAGADRAWPGYIPYTVSKAGVVALTRGLAAAYRARDIAVNCVAPGAVLRPPRFPIARWTGLVGDAPPRVDDVAAAVLYFATCPPGITGQVLRIDRDPPRAPGAARRAGAGRPAAPPIPRRAGARIAVSRGNPGSRSAPSAGGMGGPSRPPIPRRTR